MKLTVSIIRAAALFAVFSVALFGIFGEPEENSSSWCAGFFVFKAVGVVAAYLGVQLFKYWHDDQFVKFLNKFCEEE